MIANVIADMIADVIEVRPATDADRQQIVARIGEVFGRAAAERTERLWDWQWRLDPRLPTPGYRGVVAEWRGRVIGTLSTIPAGLHIDGVPVTAHWCVDALVHRDLSRQARRHVRHAAAGVGLPRGPRPPAAAAGPYVTQGDDDGG